MIRRATRAPASGPYRGPSPARRSSDRAGRGVDRDGARHRIAIYCRSPESRVALEPSLAIEADAAWFDQWRQFEHAASSRACGVLLIPRLASDPHLQDLAELRRTHPAAAIVLVTDSDFENARHIRFTPVNDVVPSEAAPAVIMAAILTAIRDQPFSLIEDRIRAAGHLRTPVRAAILRAWTELPYPGSIETLSDRIGVSRRTFYDHWHATFDGHPPYDPKLLLGWILLVRNERLMRGGYSWKRIEHELGVDRSTLWRTERRLMGGHGGGVQMESCSLLARFQVDVLGPLLEPRCPLATPPVG